MGMILTRFDENLNNVKEALDKEDRGVRLQSFKFKLHMPYSRLRVFMEALVQEGRAYKYKSGKDVYYFRDEACFTATMTSKETSEVTTSILARRKSGYNTPMIVKKKKELTVLPSSAKVVYPETYTKIERPRLVDPRYEVTEPIVGGFYDEWLELTGRKPKGSSEANPIS